jgi:hypothetical protein
MEPIEAGRPPLLGRAAATLVENVFFCHSFKVPLFHWPCNTTFPAIAFLVSKQ